MMSEIADAVVLGEDDARENTEAHNNFSKKLYRKQFWYKDLDPKLKRLLDELIDGYPLTNRGRIR